MLVRSAAATVPVISTDLAQLFADGLSSGDARTLAEQLKSAAEDELHRNAERSLEIARMIDEIGVLADDRSLVALGLMTRADALRELGRYVEANAAYDDAAAAFDQAHDEIGWARTRIGATLTARYTGRASDMLRDGERARAILARHSIWLRLARLESALGTLLCEQGRARESLVYFERALAAAQRLDPPDERLDAEILGNRSTAHLRLDERDEAARLLSRAGELFERQGSVVPFAQTQLNLGFVLVDQGQYSKALAVVSTARRAFDEQARPALAAMAGELSSDCLLRLNRPAEAAILAEQVAAEFASLGATVELAKARLLHSLAVARLGHSAEAVRDLTEAETLFRQAGCDGWHAYARLQRALMLAHAGEWPAALDLAASAGIELAREGRAVAAAQADLVRAQAMRGLHRADDALAIAARSLDDVGSRGAPWLAFQAWRLIGELRRDSGQHGKALDSFDAAIVALEELQGGILTEYRASFLADKLAVYEQAVRLCLEQGNVERAFDYAERAKSRALVDALAGGVDIRVRAETPHQQTLVDELTALRRRQDHLAAALFRPDLAGAEAPAAEPAEEDVRRRELESCEHRIGEILEALRLDSSADLERVALLQGSTYPIQPLLDTDTLLLEYFALGETDLVLFQVSADSMQATLLPGALARVEDALRLFELNLSATASAIGRPGRLMALERNARGVLGQLHEAVLAPVVDDLERFKRLLVVPHGALHQLPFAALYHDGRYLVQDHEVVVAPSASALTFCLRERRRRGLRGLVVAHSAGGQLPGALAEAAAVARLFPGDELVEREATVERLQACAAQADVIHLAAHGQCRTDAPLFSYVLLDDGQLTALDCLNLDLDCALVTLAACESGRGILAAGDEPIGLSRALLYAGARSVLQTLWQVEDAHTSGLMVDLYEGLRAGLGRGAAVYTAQRALLEQGGTATHPYFWAALVLVGDWRPLE